jgi:pyruvate decarboxylase
MIHRTLGENWDHDTFQRMSEPVRSAVAFLLNNKTFTQDVDGVIETSVKSRRSVYLYIPMDVSNLL